MQWSLLVTLDGIDISNHINGSVLIDAEEGVARIAEFSCVNFAGTISLFQWVGRPVTIDAQMEPGDDYVRIFTGVVDLPDYNPKTKITHFRCTDDLQNRAKDLVFGTGNTFFTTVTDAVYSEVIFGVMSTRSGWHVLQDAMNTVPASYDLAPDLTPTLTPWAAKTTADFSFTEDDILDASLSVSYAPRNTIKNTVDVSFQYRFPRLYQRISRYVWQHPGVCYLQEHGGDIPTVDMIDSAAKSAGWDFLSLTTVPPPPSGTYMCTFTNSSMATTSAWVIDEKARQSLAFEAELHLGKRFSREVTDAYYLTVKSDVSRDNVGELSAKLSGSLQVIFETSIWEADLNRKPHLAPFFGYGEATIDKTDITGTSRADSDKAVKCLIQQAKTQILYSHRQNFVEITIPTNPAIDRTHTVKIDTELVQAQGKARQIVHTFDTGSGSATTKVKVAMSRVEALGLVVLDSDPVVPFGPPVPAPIDPATLQQTLPTSYGGLTEGVTSTTPGYITNAASNTDTPLPHEFRVPTFAIPAAEQGPVTNDILESYTVKIPDELLTVAA